MRLKSLTYILSASLSLSLISCGGGDHDSEELATNDSTKVDSIAVAVDSVQVDSTTVDTTATK